MQWAILSKRPLELILSCTWHNSEVTALQIGGLYSK